jgi:hypothetical protein
MSRSPENQRPSSADSFDSDFQKALELSKKEHYRPPSANSVDEDLRRALELSLRQEQIASSSTDLEFERALALSAQEQPWPSSPRARISEWQQAVPLPADQDQPPRRQKTDTPAAFKPPPPVPSRPSYSSPRNGRPSPQRKVIVPGPPLPGTWVFDNTQEEDIYGLTQPELTSPRPPPRSYTPELPQGNGVGVTSPRTPRQTPNTASTSPVSSADLPSEPATGQTTPASIFGIPRRWMRHERSLTPEATMSSPQTLPPFDLSQNAATSTLRPTSTFTLPPAPDSSLLESTVAPYPAPPSVFTFAPTPVDHIDDTYPPICPPTTTFSFSSPTEDFDHIAHASTVELVPSSVFSFPVEDVNHDEHFSTSEPRPTSVFSLASIA